MTRQSAGMAVRELWPAFGALPGHWAAGIAAGAVMGVLFILYVLWPRWPEASAALDAPALPIVIADVTFKVPPAAIRRKVQRAAGTQDRIDLVYFWPTLTPAAVVPKLAPGAPPQPNERVFVNITAATTALTPAERAKNVYPRYLENAVGVEAEGLAVVAFRAGAPYKGEDLFYDAGAPERFIARCTRRAGPTPGVCLHEHFIGNADVTIRFPRDWLADWRGVAANFDKLIDGLGATPRQ